MTSVKQITHCRNCGKEYTAEERMARIAERRKNALISREKAIAAGNRFVRKKRGDVELITKLRAEGKTIREISEILKVTKSSISRRICEYKIPKERGNK